MLGQQLKIGSTYRIKLKSVFERHGVCSTSGLKCLHQGNGTFRLEGIMNFRDLVLYGIKLYDNFFAPLNISKEDYAAYYSGKPADEFMPVYETKDVVTLGTRTITVGEGAEQTTKVIHTATKNTVVQETGETVIARHVEDEVSYADHPIYKFVDVIDANDVLYVPELCFQAFPEVAINEYKDLNLVLHLGLFDKPEQLDPMLVTIRDRLALYGIKAASIKIYSTGSKWLNAEEYEKVKKIRLPAVPVEITEDNKQTYLAERAVIGGSLKRIVSNVKHPDSEIAIDSLVTKKRFSLDDRMMLIPVGPDETYDPSVQYYEVMRNEADFELRIVRSKDFEVSAGANVLGIETVSTYDNSLLHYYYQNKWYSKVQPGYLKEDESLTYYKVQDVAEGDTDEEAAAGLGTVYVAVPHEEIVKAIADGWNRTPSGMTAYYTQGGPIFTEIEVTTEDQFNQNKAKYGTLFAAKRFIRGAYKFVPTTDNVLKIIGDTFTYADEYGQKKSMELQLVDIIDQAQLETQAIVPSLTVDTTKTPAEQEAQLAYNRDMYAKKFAGRRFRYVTELDGVQETIEVTLPDVLGTSYAGKTGRLCGQIGSIAKTTMILVKDHILRNFYVQYLMANKALEANRETTSQLQAAVSTIETARREAEALLPELKKQVSTLTTTIDQKLTEIGTPEDLPDQNGSWNAKTKYWRSNSEEYQRQLNEKIALMGDPEDAPSIAPGATLYAQINYWRSKVESESGSGT